MPPALSPVSTRLLSGAKRVQNTGQRVLFCVEATKRVVRLEIGTSGYASGGNSCRGGRSRSGAQTMVGRRAEHAYGAASGAKLHWGTSVALAVAMHVHMHGFRWHLHAQLIQVHQGNRGRMCTGLTGTACCRVCCCNKRLSDITNSQ